jgi:hypothetical protein
VPHATYRREALARLNLRALMDSGVMHELLSTHVFRHVSNAALATMTLVSKTFRDAAVETAAAHRGFSVGSSVGLYKLRIQSAS